MKEQIIKENYEKISNEIKDGVTLLCATKMQTVEDINYLISLGCNVIVNKRTPVTDFQCVSLEELLKK